MTIKNLIIERLLSEKIVAIKSASYGHEKSLLFWEQAKKKLKQIDDHEEENEMRGRKGGIRTVEEKEDMKTHMKSYKAGATCRYEP